MGTTINGELRNRIFLGILAVAIIALLFAGQAMVEQNDRLLEDGNHYQQAIQLIKQSQTKDAEPLLAGLLPNHAYSYEIQWYYGLCLASNGKYKDAATHMEQARQMRPSLVSNPTFLVQFGQVLFQVGDYSRAQKYFEQTLKSNPDAELKSYAERYLQYLAQSKSKAGVKK